MVKHQHVNVDEVNKYKSTINLCSFQSDLFKMMISFIFEEFFILSIVERIQWFRGSYFKYSTTLWSNKLNNNHKKYNN